MYERILDTMTSQQSSRLIRETFQYKKEAAIFFKNTLPPEVVKLLDLENLESSFISEELKQKQTDLLFQVWKQNECVSTF